MIVLRLGLLQEGSALRWQAPVLPLWASQWKAELLDANHHADIVRVRDDVQPHIRTLVLQPRREEWQLMELFWKDTIPIPKDTIQFGKPNRNGSLYNMSVPQACTGLAWPRKWADYCHLDTSRSSGVWFVTFTLPMMQVDYTTKIFLCCFLCKLGLSWLTNCLS